MEKLPEKIYVHCASVYELTNNYPYHVEYVNLDAFIEKSCKYIDKLSKINTADYSSEYLIKEFKKFMEE